MKNLTTRTVIVINFPDGNFLFGAPFANTIDFSENIKYADEFDSIEKAQEILNLFPELVKDGGSVKKFQYQVDEKFINDAENIIAL